MSNIITLRARFRRSGQIGHIIEILEGPMAHREFDMLHSCGMPNDPRIPLTPAGFTYNVPAGKRYWSGTLTINMHADWARTQGLIEPVAA